VAVTPDEVLRALAEPERLDRVRRHLNDHASLRRFLVDEGFLSRRGGQYWRTGGPVDV
jgi:hypothetical protein